MLLLLAAGVARAHEPGLSTADFRLGHDSLELVLTFAVGDMDNMFLLDNDGDGKVSQLEFSYGKNRLAGLGEQAAIVMVDRQPLKGSEPSLRMDDLNNVEFIIRYPGGIGSNFV